jgi:hypothetical protein
MLTDYLSRLPSLQLSPIVGDPFQPHLTQLQLQYKQLRAIKQFFETGTWLSSITKQEFRTLASLASKVFIEKKKQICLDQVGRFSVSKNNNWVTRKIQKGRDL